MKERLLEVALAWTTERLLEMALVDVLAWKKERLLEVALADEMAWTKERLLEVASVDVLLARVTEHLLEDQLERLVLCKACNLSHHQNKTHHSD